jgi:hypothetical protein
MLAKAVAAAIQGGIGNDEMDASNYGAAVHIGVSPDFWVLASTRRLEPVHIRTERAGRLSSKAEAKISNAFYHMIGLIDVSFSKT